MDIKEITETLESVGLHKNEVNVYLDLIRAGKSSVHNISKRTKIHRTNVYDILEKLMKKGVVHQSIGNKRKVFYPAEPKDLLRYHKQKGYRLEGVIPQIEGIHNKPIEERKLSMAEGMPAIRTLINNLLEFKQPIVSYGIPKDALQKLGGFIPHFHKRRIKEGIEMRHVYNRNAEKRIRELNKMEHTKARYLPSLYDSEITTLVCGNKVILIFWKNPILAITIEDESIAKTYQKYFEIIWQEAKMSLY